jgi:hypothetical protein
VYGHTLVEERIGRHETHCTSDTCV